MSSIDQDSKLVEAVARGLHDTSYPEGHALHMTRGWVAGPTYWRNLARAIIPIVRKSVLEEAAGVAETSPSEILQFYERPGSPMGNQYRATRFEDIAAAIRSLASDVKEEGR